MANFLTEQSATFQLLCQVLVSNQSVEQVELSKQILQRVNLESLFEAAKQDEIAPHLIQSLEYWKIDYNPKWKIGSIPSLWSRKIICSPAPMLVPKN